MATIKNAPQAPERPDSRVQQLQMAIRSKQTRSSVPITIRLDWMYEQSAASVKPNEDELMNMPISAQKDSDLGSQKYNE